MQAKYHPLFHSALCITWQNRGSHEAPRPMPRTYTVKFGDRSDSGVFVMWVTLQTSKCTRLREGDRRSNGRERGGVKEGGKDGAGVKEKEGGRWCLRLITERQEENNRYPLYIWCRVFHCVSLSLFEYPSWRLDMEANLLKKIAIIVNSRSLDYLKTKVVMSVA